jgi:hypothetical protein
MTWEDVLTIIRSPEGRLRLSQFPVESGFLRFFDKVDATCPVCKQCKQETVHPAAPIVVPPSSPSASSLRVVFAQGAAAGLVGFSIWHLLVRIARKTRGIIFFPFFLASNERKKSRKERPKHAGNASGNRKGEAKVFTMLVIGLLFAGILWLIPHASAATTTPSMHVYNGHLLDSSSNAVTSEVSIRFSYWNSADFIAGDVTGTGAINSGASSYVGWEEVHTVTPNSKGYFSVQLGSATALPDLSALSDSVLTSLHLQVEVKPSSAANTSYELLDSDGDDATVDRAPVLSVPFARNADLLDKREIGTGSGSIPLLQSGGLLPISTVPGGTNENRFTIDADSSSGSVVLRFGQNLARELSFNSAIGAFNFNDDVNIQGNLTVEGFINGVDVTALSPAQNTHLRVSSGAGLSVDVAGGSYRVNGDITSFTGSSSVALQNNADNYLFFTGTGLTIANSFPTDKSFIPLAKVTTSGGTIRALTDRRVLQSDDRQDTILDVLHPEFDGSTFQADASNNVGQLALTFDNVNSKNYYLWTSSRTSLQDYDILVPYTLPLDFHRWRESLFIRYRTTSANDTDNKLDVQVYDTSGNPVTLSGSTTGLANTSWSTTHVEFTGTPTWTPGQSILLRLKLYAKDSFQMHVGDIHFDYVELKQE